MHSDRYVHPEFGLLSPTPRLRRELRMAFFSVLFGIVIGAAAVITLSGNNTADNARVPHGVGSASVISDDRTEPVSGYNSPQAAGIEKELNTDHTRKSEGGNAQVNSENHKIDGTTTCEGNNPSCGNVPSRASKRRVIRTPAANDAVAIGRVPLGRPDGSPGTTSVAPWATSEAHPAEGRSEDGAADRISSNRLMDQKPHKLASGQNQPQQDAANYRDARGSSRISRRYTKPAGELDRSYALDRSYGPKGFWDWSR
jgi:hypothetical protein